MLTLSIFILSISLISAQPILKPLTPLPIASTSTLSSISCISQPPFTTLWDIVSDPFTCLSLCGQTDIQDVSAIIRRKSQQLGPDGLPLDFDEGGEEYDCVCVKSQHVVETKDRWECGADDWVVYTPLRDQFGNELEETHSGFMVQS